MKTDTWNARKGREAANRDMGGTKPGGRVAAAIDKPLLKKDQTVRLRSGGRVRRANGGAADDDAETIDLTGGELDRILGGARNPKDNGPQKRGYAGAHGAISQMNKGKSLGAARDASAVLGPSYLNPDRDSGKASSEDDTYRRGGRVKLANGGSPKGKSHGKSPRSKSARPSLPPPPDPGAPPAGIGSAPPPMMGGAGLPPPGMNTGGRVVRDGKTNRFKTGGAAHEMNESKAERDYEDSHGVKEPPRGLKLAAGGAAKMRRDVANSSGKPVSGVGKQVVNAGKPGRGPKLYDTI